MNNIVSLNHRGFFIYIDLDYPKSYHDVNKSWHKCILILAKIFHTWKWLFWIFFGDLLYMGGNMFIIHMITQWELALNANHVAMWTFTKMHAYFRMQMEWGISGLKRKWRCLMKRFNSTTSKYMHFFQTIILFTNFPHRRWMDLIDEVVWDQNPNLATHG